MRWSSLALAVAGLLLAPVLCSAEDYFVRSDGVGDFPTIQAAIDAASNGDVVHVAPGRYSGPGNRDLDFKGKEITVRGNPDNPREYVIDADGSEWDPHRGFIFHSGEGPGAVIEGLRIINGYAGYGSGDRPTGGGILITSSSPVISHAVIESTISVSCAAGIAIEGHSFPLITGTVIAANSDEDLGSVGGGGGAWCYDHSFARFVDCVFSGNYAATVGGAIAVRLNSGAQIRNSVFSENMAGNRARGVLTHPFSSDGGETFYWDSTSSVTLGGCHISDLEAIWEQGRALETGDRTSTWGLVKDLYR